MMFNQRGIYEAHVDIHGRIKFEIRSATIFLRRVRTHDTGNHSF